MTEQERQRAIHARLSGMAETPALRGRRPVPTGFSNLDAALGIGGLPPGRIVEIFGPASCGKTALALQIARGAAAAWIDAEHVFDAAFAAQLGVGVSRLPVAEPDTAEEALEIAGRFAESGAVDLVVIDSAAALLPELERDTGVGIGGLHNRVLSSALRRLARTATRSGTCLVFLNQTRAHLGPSGASEVSAGGPALKLHAAVRIALSATGRRVRFRILRNTPAAPFGAGEFEWRPGRGFVELP